MSTESLPDGPLEVLNAFYGSSIDGDSKGTNVTDKVRSLIDREELHISGDTFNELFGDTAPGLGETLKVEFRYGSSAMTRERVVAEAEALTITRESCRDGRHTWQQHAGRLWGSEDYHFGDLTRGAARGLASWAEKPKTKDGYEFGDLFLKKTLRVIKEVWVLSNSGAQTEEDLDSQESQQHKDIAKQLNNDLKDIVEKIETNLPRLERVLEKLDAKSEKDVTDKSLIYRLRYGKPGSPPPLDKYKKTLEEAKMVSQTAFEARHVSHLESVENLLRVVADSLAVARECEKTANDICDQAPPTAGIEQ